MPSFSFDTTGQKVVHVTGTLTTVSGCAATPGATPEAVRKPVEPGDPVEGVDRVPPQDS